MTRTSGGPNDGCRYGPNGGGHNQGVPEHHGGGGEDQRGVTLGSDVGGSHSPVWVELLLQWMDPQDPTSILFSLNDATESIERESLNEGILAMMEVLN